MKTNPRTKEQLQRELKNMESRRVAKFDEYQLGLLNERKHMAMEIGRWPDVVCQHWGKHKWDPDYPCYKDKFAKGDHVYFLIAWEPLVLPYEKVGGTVVDVMDTRVTISYPDGFRLHVFNYNVEHVECFLCIDVYSPTPEDV